jgi:hypothetical protein
LVRAREAQRWRRPSLDYSNCRKHIVLCVPEVLSVLTSAWVDSVAAFVVQLDVVVAIEVLIALREISLSRLKLDEFIRVRDVVGRLEC